VDGVFRAVLAGKAAEAHGDFAVAALGTNTAHVDNGIESLVVGMTLMLEDVVGSVGVFADRSGRLR
jgi:hypothetical protein